MTQYISRISSCLLCVLALALANAAEAQTFPSKSVRFVVPFSPGSGSDTIARIIASGLVDLGYMVIGDTSEAFAAHIRSEITNLARILKDVRVE